MHEKGWNQVQLATAAGVSTGYVSRIIKKGDRTPTFEFVDGLYKNAGINPLRFFIEDEEREGFDFLMEVPEEKLKKLEADMELLRKLKQFKEHKLLIEAILELNAKDRKAIAQLVFRSAKK